MGQKVSLEIAMEKAKAEYLKHGYLLDYINREEFLTMAIRMLKSNVSLELIALFSELTIEEIQQIQNENND